MLNPLLCSAALLAALLLPSAASADDELGPPADEPPAVAPDPDPALPPPPPEPPIAESVFAPPPPPAAAPDPCAGERSRWRKAGDRCGGASARWGEWRGRFAIGVSRSRVEMEDDTEGTQKALVARVAGNWGWAAELELSKLKLGDDDGRLVGGAMIKTFGRRMLAPYVLAGAGRGKLDRGDGLEQRLRFGEVGGGLMLRMRRISIGADLRHGARFFGDCGEEGMEPVAERRMRSSDDDPERYTRGRIVALLHF